MHLCQLGLLLQPLFYVLKRWKVVKVRYEISSVIVVWRKHGHVARGINGNDLNIYGHAEREKILAT